MGFSLVHRKLQEVFPQVDSRVLKAFAFEHSEDVDVAVEAVLSEVIPYLSEQSLTVRSANQNNSSPSSSQVVVDHGKTVQVEATVDPVDFISEKSTEAGPSNFNGTLIGTIEAKNAGSSVQINSPVQLNVTAPVANNDDSYIHLDLDSETLIDSRNVTQESVSSKTSSEKDDIVNPEKESSITTKSQEKCSTQLLEEIFEESKNNKNILMTAMNSVVDLIKEVELKEKAAEEVKEEASQGCSYYYAKVDELKQTLVRAKEANDMHAGEVYAAKAIVATELKELQLRLLSLSDERNKSLAILDEMRKALEIRLGQALEGIRAADEEKVEKEKAAQEALLFQENQMEKVVEESKKLKLEAEDNTKLQEYLMDRGRAIDVLQGEMFVKCQDVLLLKENFDKGIPLSESLSCSQTSSIFASFSSFKSTTRLPLEPESYETPKTGPQLDDYFEKSSPKSEAGQSPKSPIHNHDYNNNNSNNNALVDDEWELFDKDDFLMS